MPSPNTSIEIAQIGTIKPKPIESKNPTKLQTALNKKEGANTLNVPSNTAPPAYDVNVIGPVANADGTPGNASSDKIVLDNKLGTSSVLSNAELQQSGKTVFPEQPLPPSPPQLITSEIGEIEVESLNPFDRRLAFGVDPQSGRVVYAMSAEEEYPLVDGVLFVAEETGDGKVLVTGQDADDEKVFNDAKEFYGVPSLFNPNSYINLQAAGGYKKNKYIIEKENSIRWYNVTEPGIGNKNGVQPSSAPTVAEIIKWSQSENNAYKFPYKYVDFAFCKWWKKIPNNHMITLRRYPFPVNDSVTSAEETRGEIDLTKLSPVATMVTFLGEDPGNKMSSILGPIETGLKWGEAKANVWEVSTQPGEANINNPAPNLAKALGFLTSGGKGARDGVRQPIPPDPYENGPYANRVLGPINVIDSTKKRERGLEFKHSVSLVFEYNLRSIGGINTKAAGLDIIANAMIMGSASAPFWGGANRFMPYQANGTLDPFLGGNAGRKAWLQGNPDAFFEALKGQFTTILENLGDVFNQLAGISSLEDVINLGKKSLKEYMNYTSSGTRSILTGLHSLLTGAPVGEWHVCVGPPQNPIMMMGNMICTGVKLEFGDELGPDDFPSEIKITVTLEHGMPRDRDGIESIFNKGRGRMYSLPKGYEESISSAGVSNIDKSTGKIIKGEFKDLPPDRANNRLSSPGARKPVVGNVYGSLYAQGYGYVPGLTDKNSKDASQQIQNRQGT